MKHWPPPPNAYVGFWLRLWASVVDTVAVSFVVVPILWAVYGREYFDVSAGFRTLDALVSWGLPAVCVVSFWIYRSATPGKMVISARIVDARTGDRPSTRQCIIRYAGYYLSIVGLGVGFLWIAFDKRKQGWHDKIAGTVVIRSRRHDGDGHAADDSSAHEHRPLVFDDGQRP